MSEQSTETGGVAPDQNTFDFSAYIAGKSTFPGFKHTVYLDQESGMELVRVSDEYTKMAERAKEIQRILSSMGESSGVPLVSEEMDELYEEVQQIETDTTALEPTIERLKKKVHASGITLKLSVGTAERLAQVVRAAEREYDKKHGRKKDDDPEYITGKAGYVLAAQLEEFCVGIELPDGTEQSPPSVDGFRDLLGRLIASESVRLMTVLNEKLDSSVTWADQIDAGFPGGGDDVAGQPLGGAGAQDGQVVVGAPVVGPHGGGTGLVGPAQQDAFGRPHTPGGGDL